MSEKTGSLKVSILQEKLYPLWDEFVKNSPQGTFFNSIKWAEIIASSFNRPFSIIICEKQNNFVAGILVFENKRFGFNFLTPVFLYPYSGPVFYRPIDEKYQKTIANQLDISSKLIQFLRKKYKFWVLDTHFSFQDMRSFQWAGCEVEPSYDYKIKIKSIKELDENLNQTTRKKIKQIQELNPKIIERSDPNELIRMYFTSYRRHKIKPPVKREKIEVLLKKALELPQINLYYIKLKDEIVAGRVVLIDENTVYDLLAGSDDKSGAGSTYLLYNILNSYIGKHDKFCFLGAGHQQVEQFKRGFGGELAHGFRIRNKAKFPFSFLVKIRESQMRFWRGL